MTYPFVCKTGNFATIPVLFFTDENDEILERVLISEIRDEYGQSKNYTKIITADIKKVMHTPVSNNVVVCIRLPIEAMR